MSNVKVLLSIQTEVDEEIDVLGVFPEFVSRETIINFILKEFDNMEYSPVDRANELDCELTFNFWGDGSIIFGYGEVTSLVTIGDCSYSLKTVPSFLT